VYRCIDYVSTTCAGIPWLMFSKSRSKLTEIEDHPLLDLLDKPNPFQAGPKFIEAVVAYLQLAGNSYITTAGPSGNKPPLELWTLRPDRVKVVPGDAVTLVRGYEYTANNVTVGGMDTINTRHLKTFHPTNDWYGLSPIQAAARSIDQNNEAKAWNVAMLQNGAKPTGALSSTGSISDDEYDRLRRLLNDEWTGTTNAGTPLLLEGGMTWQEMGVSPKDMDWLEGQKLSAREIAIAFGVPPELIGDNSNKTYSNYQEARKAYYEEKILPLMDWLQAELNEWLTVRYGDQYVLMYDKDSIEALQEDRQVVWTNVLNAVKAGVLTPNEAREELGYELYENEAADLLYMTTEQLPIEQAAEPPVVPPVSLLPGQTVENPNPPDPNTGPAPTGAEPAVPGAEPTTPAAPVAPAGDEKRRPFVSKRGVMTIEYASGKKKSVPAPRGTQRSRLLSTSSSAKRSAPSSKPFAAALTHNTD
jgi:HK97 family phage portal protein